MRKTTTCIFTVLFFSLIVISDRSHAQKVFFVFAHGLYAMPAQQDFKAAYSSGVGVEAGAGIGWNKTFLVATTGYTHFSNTNNSSENINFVPVKAGIRQFLLFKFFYLHGDAGLGSITINNEGSTRFSADLGAGVKLGRFEAQLDYDGYLTRETSSYPSWIGIKAGFNIGF